MIDLRITGMPANAPDLAALREKIKEAIRREGVQFSQVTFVQDMEPMPVSEALVVIYDFIPLKEEPYSIDGGRLESAIRQLMQGYIADHGMLFAPVVAFRTIGRSMSSSTTVTLTFR